MFPEVILLIFSLRLFFRFKGFAYIAILMLAILIAFFVIMDALKYIFGIDPVQSDRKALRLKQQQYEKKKNELNRPKVAYCFQYVN